MKKLSTLLLLLLPAVHGLAQEPVQMADTMRSEGKIYVVVAIIVVIVAGLVAYLISIDRKVGRLEKKLPDQRF